MQTSTILMNGGTTNGNDRAMHDTADKLRVSRLKTLGTDALGTGGYSTVNGVAALGGVGIGELAGAGREAPLGTVRARDRDCGRADRGAADAPHTLGLVPALSSIPQ